jgi:hypothetical protein
VYVIDPAGVTGRVKLTESSGLVLHTGGAAFYNSADWDRAVATIRQEATHYYLLGYQGSERDGDLHQIDVRVKQPGVHLRARRTRG